MTTIEFIDKHFKIILLFLAFFGVTGGFGYIGKAYFTSAEMYGLINSFILQIKISAGLF